MTLEKKSTPFGINPTKRFVSKGGEEELYNQYKIGKTGLVELVDYMGGDGTVERVATSGHGNSIFNERPSTGRLIHYLNSKGIYEPFKSVQLKFNIQSPIETALSLVYDPGVSVNEYSGRYSVMLDSSFEPSEKIVDNNKAREIIKTFNEGRKQTTENYKKLLDMDMARELARSGLGIDNDTKYFWKTDLLNLSQFVKNNRKKFSLNHPTRDYIEAIAEVAEKVAPYSWNSLIHKKDTKLNLTMPKDEEVVDPGLQKSGWKEQKTKRVTVPALEKVLFETKHFLDHGEFQVVDYMGDDNSFSEAARTSYGEGTKTLQDNKNLVKSLIKDAHTSPIEMAEFAFESKSPMFSDPRQAGRHRTLDKCGFMGYHPIGSQFYMPANEEFKYQDRMNRQGRGKEMNKEDFLKAREIFIDDKKRQLETTNKLRFLGAPEELVRMAKGVGFYTTMWRTGDTHNLGNFLRLRLDPHAQKEVRDLAKKIDYAMSLHTPNAREAIQTYIINSMRLSEKEVRVMQKQGMLKDLDLENMDTYKGAGMVIPVDKKNEDKGYKLGREGLAFKKKLEKLLGK